MVCQTLHGRGICQREGVDVERTTLLAEVVDRLAIGREAGLTILPLERGEFRMLAIGIEPQIARNGGGVVLTPNILATLAILVHEAAGCTDEMDLLGRRSQHLTRATTLTTHGIKLRHHALRKEHTRSRILLSSRKEDLLTVGRIAPRGLLRRVGRHATRLTACKGHRIEIEITTTIRGKGDLTPIGREDGGIVIGRIRGELARFTSCGRDSPQISLVGEDYRCTIG